MQKHKKAAAKSARRSTKKGGIPKTSGKKPTAAPKPAKTMPPLETTLAFYADDFGKTLFPLVTNKFLIERGESEIKDFIAKCLDDTNPAYSFSAQRRVYAVKPGNYLRRTVKLDAVAEYYIYDVVFRNKKLFRKPHEATRTHYGYRFERGHPIAPTAAYKGFKGALFDYSNTFERSLGMDVATYFNSIYHHDIVSWFSELGASNEDAEGLGQLLREINSGRSVDCLPQGLYPTKMIGNDFLRFVDNYHELKSEQIIRFMDDIYLFSDDERTLADDFQVIQRLVGDKGLSINPRKTRINDAGHAKIDQEIDEVKKNLLKRRRFLITIGYDDEGEEIIKEQLVKWPLSDEEVGYIDKLLEKPDIEEDDAELVLTIMRGHASRVERRLPDIIRSYPHLAKNVHSFCASLSGRETLADIVLEHAKRHDRIPEYQLFWFGAMLEDYLMKTSKASALISVLFNHRSASPISKAKVLEIPDLRFGLPELRSEFLGSGQSDWLAWSSAVGSRSLKPASRNHKLKYFGKSSQMNHLIANIMLKS
jgi:hypothetical protein